VRLLIAIPVFNERQYLLGVLDKVRSLHPDVLVVDDGSTDGTGDLLNQLAARREIHLIRHQLNLGYGQSLIDAFAYADRRGYDWVITMDCDEQHEPEMIPQFIREIERNDADIISGSRYLHVNGGDDAPPPDRRRINGTLTELINQTFGLHLTDAFCGFKAHRLSAMRRLHLDVSGYAFPMQLWPQAAAAHLRIREIPVRLIYNDPNRHFGGTLDDADIRLSHYLSVLCTEAKRVASPERRRKAVSACCCPA
jgi:glycosyltransferase involved in cell wall biosynthesis